MIKISRGLDVPILGQPEQRIEEAAPAKQVALLGDDYVGLKPTMLVAEGDIVKKGQPVFTDKKTHGVVYTAPAAGKVVAVNRGAKRVFESLVIEVAGDDAETFAKYTLADLEELPQGQVKQQLIDSGLWTSFRTRPFSKVPATNTSPAAIFINAMDSNPLAAKPAVVIEENKKAFDAGLLAVSKLTQGTVHLCKCDEAVISSPPSNIKNIKMSQFTGKHPAGLSGTHIHFLSPVGMEKTVWYLNYQDVIAIGTLFLSGEIDTTRVVALAGPQVEYPRLMRTQMGAAIEDISKGELKGDNNRLISGSVLGGRHAQGSKAYLGRYHLQISVIEEGNKRDFMGWLSPGLERFSFMGIYLSQLMPKKRFNLTSNTNGSPRAMVPIGAYERVMPLDILPTQLLRALVTGDIENAIKLGALELDEEDLALCTFVCSGKYEYGPILRDMLTRIEKEAM